MRLWAGLAVCAMGVSACSEQQILRYQDRPAETALECEAAYQAARKRGSGTYVNYSSGASVTGAAFGLGIAKGMIDSAYRNCLARVAGNASPTAAPVAVVDADRNYRKAVEPQYQPVMGCPAGANVIHGGTQYCTAR